MMLPTMLNTGERISSAIAIGHPKDKSRASLIMEYSSSMSAAETEVVVRQMVIEGLKNRKLEVGYIESISVECIVDKISYAATFAAVVEL